MKAVILATAVLSLAFPGCGDSSSPAGTASGTGGTAGIDGGAGGGGTGGNGTGGNGTGGDGGVAGDGGSETGGGAGEGGAGGAGGIGGDGGTGGEAGAAGSGGADTIDGRPKSPDWGRIVFNEVLIDGTVDGDPNGDGDADPVDDQFVELVHTGAQPFALGGFTLVEQDFPDLPRHTFGSGISVAPGAAIVVFGGGDAPDPTATTTFFAANAADPGLPFGLHLTPPSDTMWLLDGDGKVVARFCYGGTAECALGAAMDQSLTRDPDVTGDFVPHVTAAGSNGAAFSVGTKVDGSPF